MRYLFWVLLAFGCASCANSSTRIAAAPPVYAGPVIARLVGRHDTIVIRSGDTGPTYSLESARGEVVVPDMTIGKLAVTNPNLAERIHQLQDSVMLASIRE